MTSTMTTAARMLLAALLIGAAAEVWSAVGTRATTSPSAHEQIATFRDSAPATQHALRPWTRLMQTVDRTADPCHEASTRDYWHRRYDALIDRGRLARARRSGVAV